MKRKVMSGVGVLVVLTLLGFQQLSRQEAAPTSEPSAKPLEEKVQVTEKDVEKTLDVIRKVEAPSLEKVVEELKSSGDEEALASFQTYQKQQKTYDAAYRKYEAAHEAYRAAVHAAADGNSPEVEAALAQVDAEAAALQTETEALNASSAEFLEEYRRYTFEKFGLALN